MVAGNRGRHPTTARSRDAVVRGHCPGAAAAVGPAADRRCAGDRGGAGHRNSGRLARLPAGGRWRPVRRRRPFVGRTRSRGFSPVRRRLWRCRTAPQRAYIGRARPLSAAGRPAGRTRAAAGGDYRRCLAGTCVATVGGRRAHHALAAALPAVLARRDIERIVRAAARDPRDRRGFADRLAVIVAGFTGLL